MIRYMRHSDLADVARLESELFTSASWSLAALERELDGPDRAYYVWVGAAPRRSQLDAPSPEGICGYAGIWYGGADAEVMTIGVAKDCQHAGIGRCLMRELIGAARRRSCRCPRETRRFWRCASTTSRRSVSTIRWALRTWVCDAITTSRRTWTP